MLSRSREIIASKLLPSLLFSGTPVERGFVLRTHQADEQPAGAKGHGSVHASADDSAAAFVVVVVIV